MLNEQGLRKILEGGGGLPGRLVRGGLWLPGQLYGVAMRLRRAAFRRGVLPSFRPSVPVASVGNLTAGGSGKTPFVAMLAREFAAMGKKPAVLLRGYRRDGDGRSDEAVLYQTICPGVMILPGADRRVTARAAVAAGAEVLLLDDGFQHLRLERDLDIVLIDAASPWGGGSCLPGGLLREPPLALADADVVVVTRSDQRSPAFVAALEKEIARLAPTALRLRARHRPVRLTSLDGASLPLASLRGRKVVALSGIARPEAFQRTLSDLGATVVEAFSQPDHADFEAELVARAVAAAERLGGVVVMTEKDGARRIFSPGSGAAHTRFGKYIWILGIEQEVEGREMLTARLRSLFP